MDRKSIDQEGATHRSEGVRVLFTLVCAGALIAAVLLADRAPAQTLQEKADTTQSKIDDASAQEGVLTTRINHVSREIEGLQGQVADLRNREATVAAELERVQAELSAARKRLEILRGQLKRAIALLEERLVEIYKSGEPDLITVLLNADGFDELVERAEYLNALQDRDSTVISRVRDLRNEMRGTVEAVKASRDRIAEQKAELEAVRSDLEARTADLAAARASQRSTLDDVRSQREVLEGDLSEISKKIQEQLGSAAPLPAGPIQQGSSGFIWPVNGILTSGFGMRWGSMHEGIDIAAPEGTPIRAAKAGNIVIAAYTGGYGNYTCIDHGGGLSTCYGHQSAFARTSGYVSQGTVTGYVGSTGHSTGPHLHFEVRINGTAVDPLGYL